MKVFFIPPANHHAAFELRGDVCCRLIDDRCEFQSSPRLIISNTINCTALKRKMLVHHYQQWNALPWTSNHVPPLHHVGSVNLQLLPDQVLLQHKHPHSVWSFQYIDHTCSSIAHDNQIYVHRYNSILINNVDRSMNHENRHCLSISLEHMPAI